MFNMSYGDQLAVREFKLISCFSKHIQWGPIVTIPPHSPGSRLCLEDIDDRWMHFSEYLAPCASDYIDWFYMILHPFMRPAQLEDPVKHLPVVQDDTYVEPDILQYLVAATAMEEAPAHAHSHVEQPQHSVEACQEITESLEQLLNLRIMTKDTKIYYVMKDCIRIARGVAAD
ncbi:hypothetical protein HKD37_02G005425 [Glycine soja]